MYLEEIKSERYVSIMVHETSNQILFCVGIINEKARLGGECKRNGRASGTSGVLETIKEEGPTPTSRGVSPNHQNNGKSSARPTTSALKKANGSRLQRAHAST